MQTAEVYESLREDYNEVKQRLMSDRLVKKFVLKYADDKTFKELEDALKEENYEVAFRAAHTLKGICLNLGFKAFFKVCSELTEYLRPLDERIKKEEAEALFSEVRKKQEELLFAISKLDKD